MKTTDDKFARDATHSSTSDTASASASSSRAAASLNGTAVKSSKSSIGGKSGSSVVSLTATAGSTTQVGSFPMSVLLMRAPGFTPCSSFVFTN